MKFGAVIMTPGIYVALVTPFDKDNSIDYNALNNLIEYQLNNGVNKFVICGSTGEGTLLNANERRELTNKTIDIVGNRGIVGVGCSAGSINEAVALVSLAKNCKAEFALVAPPYYIKPTQDGIVHFYKEVSRQTDFPIVAYNIPSRVGVSMNFDTLLKISKIKNIVGVKDATTHFDIMSQLSSACNDDFIILSGDDLTFPASLMYGTRGTISALANYCPKLVCNVFDLWKRGYTASLVDVVHKIELTCRATSVASNPIPLKYLLSTKGLIKNIVRPPLLPLNEKQVEVVDNLTTLIK